MLLLLVFVVVPGVLGCPGVVQQGDVKVNANVRYYRLSAMVECKIVDDRRRRRSVVRPSWNQRPTVFLDRPLHDALTADRKKRETDSTIIYFVSRLKIEDTGVHSNLCHTHTGTSAKGPWADKKALAVGRASDSLQTDV